MRTTGAESKRVLKGVKRAADGSFCIILKLFFPAAYSHIFLSSNKSLSNKSSGASIFIGDHVVSKISGAIDCSVMSGIIGVGKKQTR